MANTAMLTLETVEDQGLRFRATTGSGRHTTVDSGPGMVAPSPVEMLLVSLGGCEGMDVISILRKKRQRVTRYQIAVSGERRAEHPRRYTRIEVVHRLRGHDLSESAVADAVRLSAEKYCSVRSSLDPDLELENRWEIVPESAAPAAATPPVAGRQGLSELILRVADVDRSIAF